MVLMEAKGQPWAGLTASPLLYSVLGQDGFVLCIRCFFVVSSWDRMGVPFIVGFRSIRFCQAKLCSIWTHEGEDVPHHMIKKPWMWGAPYFLPRGITHSRSSIYRKNHMTKVLGPRNVWKVHECQKHAKTSKICFVMLKPNERGLFRESPNIMTFTDLNKLSNI
jgi:hypothetical protein